MFRQTSRLANFSKSLIKNLPINPKQVKRFVADKCCSSNGAQAAKETQFKSDAFKPPNFLPITVYRPVNTDEKLGPGAHKCKEYKNAEYFAYNRFSFYELQTATLELAKSSEGGVLYEEESEDESAYEDISDYDGNEENLKGDKLDEKDGKECKEGKDVGGQQKVVNKSCEGESMAEKGKTDKCEK
ncbi:uncharacterized protein [Eurosta solidaginis]|uniref:uncharacterized protein n=1 Tax=Eurosta solidaginis TaxID=178769 RepID=UPI0035314890